MAGFSVIRHPMTRTCLCALLFAMSAPFCGAQSLTPQFPPSSYPPPNLLSSRAVALYDYRLSLAEIDEYQKGFQRIGLDAIAWFPTDVVMAGEDAIKAYSAYFTERQVAFILFADKGADGFRLTTTSFTLKPALFDVSKPAWQVSRAKLNDLLTTLLQDSWRAQKKANYLVNEKPELDLSVDIVKGRRQEFYAIDLKVDNLAVPKFGNVAMDTVLERFFERNYPLKYKLFDAGTTELDMRSKGFTYVLCYVHTRAQAAKEVLDYDLSKNEKSYASIAFPDGQLQLKVLPKEEVVYKFYFRHIDNGNIFLGTKWDADIQWLDALRNHVLGFKQEAKIN